jgi:hypothetical protein
MPPGVPEMVLATIFTSGGGDASAREAARAVNGAKSWPSIARADSPVFTVNETGVNPDFGGRPAQLMERGPGLIPLVASREGVLLGRLSRPGAPEVWILADPDLTSNHGIGTGENLRFALALFDLWTRERPRPAAITFDEGHLKPTSGEGKGPGLWPFARDLARDVARFPRAGPIVLAFLAAGLLMLFGARKRWPAARPAPPSFGKGGLVANTALLLERPAYRGELFRRYRDQAMRSAARALKAPPGARASPAALAAWLDARAPGRGPWRLARIADEAERELSLPEPSTRRLLSLAGRLRRWREEAEVGSGTGRADNGRGARRGREGHSGPGGGA